MRNTWRKESLNRLCFSLFCDHQLILNQYLLFHMSWLFRIGNILLWKRQENIFCTPFIMFKRISKNWFFLRPLFYNCSRSNGKRNTCKKLAEIGVFHSRSKSWICISWASCCQVKWAIFLGCWLWSITLTMKLWQCEDRIKAPSMNTFPN